MKIAIKIALGFFGLYLVLMLGSGLAIRVLLSTTLGDRIRESAQQSLPVEVSLSGGSLDLGQWMLFRPALALNDLRVGNPSGYGDGPLLSADRVFARAGLFSLLQGETSVSAIEIDAPVLHVEANQSGQTNIEALLKALEKPDAPEPDVDAPESTTELSIASLRIRDGRVVYSSPSEPDFVATGLNLEAHNISREEAFDFSAQLGLFEEKAIEIAFDGVVGPLARGSLPAQGTLSVDSALGRIPSDFRQKTLGSFLEDPGANSAVQIQVNMEGDLLGVVSGVGSVDLEDIRLGHAGDVQFPLSGQSELLLTLLNPIANPVFHLIMPEASLDFGAGRWQGGVEAQYDGTTLSGKSTGAIDGVDVDQMLTAFTDAGGVAFGNLKMPRYDIRFSGRDSQQIFDSLSGGGRIELTDGRFEMFDTLQTIEGHAQELISGESAAAGSTSFVEFSSDLAVRDQRVQTTGIVLRGDTLSIEGDGSFGFDQSLNLDLRSAVSGSLAQLLGGRQDASGVAWVVVPLRVRGSVSNPFVTPDLGRLVRDEAIRRVGGLLDSLIGGETDEAPAEDEPEQPKPRLPFDLRGLLNKTPAAPEEQ
ncbi:MAG: AsmA family protein [Acidobacteria bacterium]|nr:AsmA family protein [Acidobacteriota bacterium]MDA1235053.1 AsmA family protein [Acidobacteriota bacterium]